MVQPIDRAAFRAAMQAAADGTLTGVTLPGIGACFKRRLTVNEVLEAEEVRKTLKAAGLTVDRKVDVAIGLAQALCDESGCPLLNPSDPADIALLIALPWESVRAAVNGGADAEGEGAAPNA